MEKILFNISNHPSHEWEEKQREGWDKIIDMPFPNIDPHLSLGEVWEIATTIISEMGKKAWEIDAGLKHREPIYIMCEGEYSFTLVLTEAIRLTWWYVIFAFPTSSRIVLADGRHRFQFEGWRFIHLRCSKFFNPRVLVLNSGQKLEVFASFGGAYIGRTNEGKLIVVFEDDPLFPKSSSIRFGEFVHLVQLPDGTICDPINWIPLVEIREEEKGWRVVNLIQDTLQHFRKEKDAQRFAYAEALREFCCYNIRV